MTFRSSIGRYRLIRAIARGGMGEVHLGVLEAPGGVRRLAAVKVVLESKQRELRTALFAEARLAALIAHPNVVQLLDAGLDGDRPWFAMEYVPGLSIAEIVESAGDNVPAWIWARIVADACGAVHAVHEARDERGRPLEVVHRDVTPHNLLVNWDGFVKLVDFGIARSSLQSTVTTTGVVRGKLGYMSPEQATGARVDRRTDVFALGVLLWEALAGKRLFKRATESETIAAIVRGDVPALAKLVPSLPGSVVAAVERALCTEPSGRFATALEMQRALEQAFAESSVVVGANEVAHVLSTLVPERVREHERWFGEPETPFVDSGDSSAEDVVVTKPKRSPRTQSRTAAAALVVVAASAAFAIARPGLRTSSSAGTTPTASIRAEHRVEPAAPTFERERQDRPASAAASVPKPLPVAPSQRPAGGVAPHVASGSARSAAAARRSGLGTLHLSSCPTGRRFVSTASRKVRPRWCSPTFAREPTASRRCRSARNRRVAKSSTSHPTP
jgi:serine/threonine-protein kinase